MTGPRTWIRLAGSARSRVLLLLVAVTVAVVTAPAAALPPLTDDAAAQRLTQSVREAPRAGRSLSVTTGYDVPEMPTEGTPFDPVTAGVEQVMGPAAMAHFSPVTPTVSTVGTLAVSPAPPGEQRLARLVLSPTLDDAVRWVEGRAPAATTDPVLQVGLSATSARALRVRVGDEWSIATSPAAPEQRRRVVVVGLYDPVAAEADLWSAFSELRTPVPIPQPDGGIAQFTGLVVAPGEHQRLREVFAGPFLYEWAWAIRPDRITPADIPDLEAAMARLRSATADRTGGPVQVRSGLDVTIDRWRTAVVTTRVMDGAVGTGLVVLGIPLLLLLCRLRAEDRREADRLLTSRGASRGQSVGLALLDVAPAALAGALVGYAAACLSVGRGVPGWWAALLLAAVAVATAHSTLSGLTDLTGRGDRRRLGRVRSTTRVVALLLGLGVTVAAVLTARQTAAETPRGLAPRPDLLTQSLPVLLAVCAGVLLVLLLRGLTRLLAARGSRRGVGVWLGLLQSVRSPQVATLPVVAIVVAASLTVWLTSISHTLTEHRELQTWRETGAALRIDGDRLEDVTGTVRAHSGVHTVAPLAERPGQVAGAGGGLGSRVSVEVLLGSSAEVDAVHAGTPLEPGEDAAPPRVLGGDGLAVVTSAPLPALDRPDPTLVVENRRLPIASVVVDPGLASGDRPVVLAPREAVERALGRPVTTTRLLVAADESAAADLAAQVPGLSPMVTDVVDRAAIARSRGEEPLTAHIDTVVILTAAAAALLAALAVHALAAATATARRRVLARARVLGMRTGDRRRLVAVQVLPPAVAAIAAGLLTGQALPPLVPRLVDLSPFTGGAPWPPLTPSWAAVAAIGAGLLVLVLAVVAIDLRATTGHLTSHLRAGEDP